MKVLLKRFHLNGHTRGFLSTDSKVRITFNVSITDSGSKNVKEDHNFSKSFCTPVTMSTCLCFIQGGVYTEGDVAMTAFVLSTLAECKCKGVVSQFFFNVMT